VTRGGQIPFRASLDGKPADDAQGSDVDAEGRGTVREQATYQLIRETGRVEERLLEIEFLEAGAEAYCFTFG
jgi:hypothetical protein